MGTSDFDAVAAGSRSDLDPVSVTFRENAGEVLLPDRDVDVVAQEIGAPARRFDRPVARVDPAGVAGLEVDPVAAELEDWPRHQADCELFDLLVEHRATGVVWENVVEVLSAYASQVLVAWLRSGVIYTKLSSKHFGVRDWPAGRERLAGDHSYREEVIAHTVVRALEKLQKGLRAGTGWDPRKGLSLTSYFINGCLAEFVYVLDKEHRWWTTHRYETPEAYDDPSGVGSSVLWGSRMSADPADIVTDRIVLLEQLSLLSPTDRTVLWAHASGYSHSEIAHLLDVTAKAVERRLHRIRTTHLPVRTF